MKLKNMLRAKLEELEHPASFFAKHRGSWHIIVVHPDSIHDDPGTGMSETYSGGDMVTNEDISSQ